MSRAFSCTGWRTKWAGRYRLGGGTQTAETKEDVCSVIAEGALPRGLNTMPELVSVEAFGLAVRCRDSLLPLPPASGPRMARRGDHARALTVMSLPCGIKVCASLHAVRGVQTASPDPVPPPVDTDRPGHVPRAKRSGVAASPFRMSPAGWRLSGSYRARVQTRMAPQSAPPMFRMYSGGISDGPL